MRLPVYIIYSMGGDTRTAISHTKILTPFLLVGYFSRHRCAHGLRGPGPSRSGYPACASPDCRVRAVKRTCHCVSAAPLSTTKRRLLPLHAGLPKGQAVQMALRTLSPQVILLDELGGLDEVTALEQGLFSGVDFVATLHAATPEEATMRPQVKYLMERGAVRVLVWLTGRQAPGCIEEVRFL